MRMIRAIIACVVSAALPVLAQQASPEIFAIEEFEGSLRFVA